MKSLVTVFAILMAVLLQKVYAQAVPVSLTNTPYVAVNGITTNLNSMILHPGSIDKVDVLKKNSSLPLYGIQATNGAVIVSVKPGTLLLTIRDIYFAFNIADSMRTLRVCIGGLLMKDPSAVVIEKKMIQEIRISNDHIWLDPMEANISEQFLNIITSREH